MMSPTDLNLNKMLPATVPDFSNLLAKTIEERGLLDSLKASLIRIATGKSWSAQVAAHSRNNIGDLLDVNLKEVLIEAWNKSVILRKYKDAQRYPPDQTAIVHLSEHTIRSEHQPYLEISVNGLTGRLPFCLKLELKAKGFKLKIRDGEIHEILSGELKVNADLSCGPALLWTFETETFTIPGSIKLEPPRKIVW